jgi:hypothetical protein
MLRARSLSLLSHDAEAASAVMFGPALALPLRAEWKQVSRMEIA